MQSAVDLFEELREKYDGDLPFKKIIHDHQIGVIKAPMDEGVLGFFIRHREMALIIVNAKETRAEREATTWHELFHILRGSKSTLDRVLGKREEANADLFAALCMIPHLKDGDTIDILTEKYGVPRHIAVLRLKHEQKKAA